MHQRRGLAFKYNILVFYSPMQRIYVSDLHSPLGYHLVDLLRTDHAAPSAPAVIIGSSAEPPSAPVSQTINFSQLPQVCCRAALDCDLVLLSLEHSSHEAELILRFLEHSHSALARPIRLIGLSSVMTWEGLSPFQLEKESEREKMMGAITDEAAWRRQPWSDQQYQRRIPNNFYVRTFELQNMLLDLNKHSKISASVLSHGVLYGRQSTALQKDVLASLSGEALSCFGPGDNLVPLTHVETLLESLQKLIPLREIPFVLACDSQQYSQRQIKQIILEATGNTTPLAFRDDLYLEKEECDWSINLSVTSALQQISAVSSRRCFAEYARESLLSEFCDYNCYSPRQYVVIADKYEESDLKELAGELQGRGMILQEELERIDREITEKLAPPEPEPPAKKQQKNSILKPSPAPQEREPTHYYREAWQSLLGGKKHHNFIVVCKEAFLPFLGSELIYDRLVEILPCEPEEEEEDGGSSSIVFRSANYYSSFSLRRPASTVPASEERAQQGREAPLPYRSQSSGRKDDQLVLLNQYLLDNVLLPISEAKFALRARGSDLTLRNFIQELKDIHARCNSRSVLLSTH